MNWFDKLIGKVLDKIVEFKLIKRFFPDEIPDKKYYLITIETAAGRGKTDTFVLDDDPFRWLIKYGNGRSLIYTAPMLKYTYDKFIKNKYYDKEKLLRPPSKKGK